MILFDSTMLLLTIRPSVNAPVDKKTGKPVEYVAERTNALLAKLEKQKVKIIIPTPVLSEVLIDAGKEMGSLIQSIQKNPIFQIMPFDILAAAELAAMTYDAKKRGDKKSGSSETWAKIKFDRQIIAIAKVHNATAIYSDDVNLSKFAEKIDIDIVRLIDIPIPESAKQLPLLDISKEKEEIERTTKIQS